MEIEEAAPRRVPGTGDISKVKLINSDICPQNFSRMVNDVIRQIKGALGNSCP
jgi:hypothetical protein